MKIEFLKWFRISLCCLSQAALPVLSPSLSCSPHIWKWWQSGQHLNTLEYTWNVDELYLREQLANSKDLALLSKVSNIKQTLKIGEIEGNA